MTTLKLTRRRHLTGGRPNDSRVLADLATYRSEADLLELSAILYRHGDERGGPVRAVVDWTPAFTAQVASGAEG